MRDAGQAELWALEEKLFEAITRGDAACVREVASKSPEVLLNFRLNGDTFLQVAAGDGQATICEILLDLGLDVNDSGRGDSSGISSDVPLMDAAHNGDAETIQLLLSRGAAVDGLSDSVATPLMAAALEGHLDAVNALLDAGAEINRENSNLQWTSLDFAVEHGHEEVAKLLRARGAIRLQSEQVDWSDAPDRRFVEQIESVVGPVLPVSHSRIVAGVADVLIRIAKVNPRRESKLLFTSGLATDAGIEVGICLTSDWPLNRDSRVMSQYDWPLRLLFIVSDAIASGEVIEHGLSIAVDAPMLSSCELPAGMVVLVAKHQTLEDSRRDKRELPELLLLHLVKQPAKRATVEWARAMADKKAAAKWTALAHRTAIANN